MRPSSVRSRILREHEEIRARLDALEEVAKRLSEQGDTAIEEAVSASRAFYELLLEHIDLEDAILAPALRESDAWGDVRAEKLTTHHSEQRAELDALARGDASVSADELAARMNRLIADVREDMKHEESEVLTLDILRDDVIGIDVEGG